MSVELPKDAKGQEIPLDTKVLYDECGNEYQVYRYCCSIRQSIPERVWEAVILDSSTYYTSCLYITPPDIWEKLEEDLNRACDSRYYEACTYFHRDKDEDGCISCPGGEDGCGRIAMRDILNRIRRLRGEN